MPPPRKWHLLYAGGLVVSAFLGHLAHEKFVPSQGAPLPLVPSAVPVSAAVASTDAEDAPKETDLAAELLDTLAVPNRLKRTVALSAKVLALDPADLPSAVSWARNLSGQNREELLPLLVGKWAETDPEAALNSLLNMDRDMQFLAMGPAVKIWAAKDAAALQAWEDRLPNGMLRWSIFDCRLAAMARNDPAAALQYLLSQREDESLPDYMFESVFREWVGQDPAVATAAALRLPGREARTQAIEAVALSWARINPVAALAWAATIPANQRQAAFNAAYQEWFSMDVQGAMRAIQAMPSGRSRDGVILAVVDHASPESMLFAAQLVDLLPEASRSRAIDSVARLKAKSDSLGAVENDPRATADYWIQNLSADDAADDSSPIAKLLSEWANEDATQAVAYAQGIQNEKIRVTALFKVTEALADLDPGAAAALTPYLRPSEVEKVSREIAFAWAQENPAQASAWAQHLSGDRARAAAMQGVAASWARRDLVRAANWLTTLPAGADRDAALDGYATESMDIDPLATLEWITTITDATFRNRHLAGLAKRWLFLDENAASSWIRQSAKLTDERKESLLRKPAEENPQ